MGIEDKHSKWSHRSLLDEQSDSYCLMQPVSVGDGRRKLEAAGFSPGPNAGSGALFEIWISPSGFPQMLPYLDFPANQFFDGEELSDSLSAN